MLFTYLANDTVVGFNRAGYGDELTGECSSHDLVFGMLANCYTSSNGTLIPKSQAEVMVIARQLEKDNAYAGQVASVEKMLELENLKNFPFNGDLYISDKDNIQSTQNQCLSQEPNEPILTMRGTQYEGMWPVVGAFVKFNAAGFINFSSEYFKRGSDNFTTRSAHISNLTTIYKNTNSTAADIIDYNYSGGWV